MGNQEMVAGVVRHALTAIGGFLMAKGIISSEEAEGWVGGIMTFIGTVWSLVTKRKK